MVSKLMRFKQIPLMAGKEEASITRTPLLGGSNYPYWKTRMKTFIKFIDESAWSAVEEGWSPLVDVDEDKNKVIKKKSRLSSEEVSKANANGKL